MSRLVDGSGGVCKRPHKDDQSKFDLRTGDNVIVVRKGKYHGSRGMVAKFVCGQVFVVIHHPKKFFSAHGTEFLPIHLKKIGV